MDKLRILLYLALGAVLAGCSASKPAESAATGAGQQAAPEAQQTTAEKQPAEAPQNTEPPSNLTVPESLKTPALEYFGVKGQSNLKYEVASSDGTKTELTRELKFVSASPEKALIEETAFSSLGGSQKFEHEVTKNGIYSRQIMQSGKKSEFQLALPADMKVGTKWQNKTTIEVAGQPREMTSSSRIVGFEKVKVGGKTYEAIKLSEEATLGGAVPEKWKSTSWLAKGVGLVKLEIERTVKGMPPVKSTMTLK